MIFAIYPYMHMHMFGLAGTAVEWIRSFLTIERSRSPTVDACRRRSVFCSACRKGRCSAHCCILCMIIPSVCPCHGLSEH